MQNYNYRKITSQAAQKSYLIFNLFTYVVTFACCCLTYNVNYRIIVDPQYENHSDHYAKYDIL